MAKYLMLYADEPFSNGKIKYPKGESTTSPEYNIGLTAIKSVLEVSDPVIMCFKVNDGGALKPNLPESVVSAIEKYGVPVVFGTHIQKGKEKEEDKIMANGLDILTWVTEAFPCHDTRGKVRSTKNFRKF